MYVCKHCETSSLEYKGQCGNCKKWNCLQERDPSTVIVQTKEVENESRAEPITEIDVTVDKRRSTGMVEVNRVLGGEGDNVGIVYPSLVLMAGDPGIGKSTVLVQIAANVARLYGPVIYITGEESKSAVTARATRLGAKHERLHLMSTGHLEHLEAEVRRLNPVLSIVDSTQTMHRMDMPGEAGSITQVKGITSFLRPLAKRKDNEMGVILVGHVTKDGSAAGPKTLEHLVDATLYFEGEMGRPLRVLRSAKNRFNNTTDIGVLEMSQVGLVDIASPSAHFLAQRRSGEPGTVVTAVCGGAANRRAILVEIQVLFGTAEAPRLQVSASGLDQARVIQMCAVLGRKAGVQGLDKAQIFSGAVGGLDVDERAADLAIAVAIASQVRQAPVQAGLIVFGEVGLMGELRDTPQAHLRLKEAAAQGFTKALVPPFKALEPVDGIEIMRAETLAEAIDMALD
jgi:DNA repair protein RadA/Sms